MPGEYHHIARGIPAAGLAGSIAAVVQLRPVDSLRRSHSFPSFKDYLIQERPQRWLVWL
jgi:hypothetical protein